MFPLKISHHLSPEILRKGGGGVQKDSRFVSELLELRSELVHWFLLVDRPGVVGLCRCLLLEGVLEVASINKCLLFWIMMKWHRSRVHCRLGKPYATDVGCRVVLHVERSFMASMQVLFVF